MRRGLVPLLVMLGLGGGSAAAERPLVAVVADNAGTETTDFLVPFGVLSRADVATVRAVALREGPVELHPALVIEGTETIASFDALHPNGADYVIVPAVMNPDAPALVRWLRGQAERGAVLMSICDGAFVLAHTGALDGHAATAHWYSLEKLAEQFPRVRWVRDRRWVDDGRVITTTGVSASIPASLALVERIAGEQRAREVAASLGVGAWSDAHDTDAFGIGVRTLGAGVLNWLAFWRHERVGLRVGPGVDEASLGLLADALARTWRAEAVVLSASASVPTRHGLRVVAGAEPVDRVQALPQPDRPSQPYLDATLAAITTHYGDATAAFVALQLEATRPD